MDLFNTSTKTT